MTNVYNRTAHETIWCCGGSLICWLTSYSRMSSVTRLWLWCLCEVSGERHHSAVCLAQNNSAIEQKHQREIAQPKGLRRCNMMESRRSLRLPSGLYLQWYGQYTWRYYLQKTKQKIKFELRTQLMAKSNYSIWGTILHICWSHSLPLEAKHQLLKYSDQLSHLWLWTIPFLLQVSILQTHK